MVSRIDAHCAGRVAVASVRLLRGPIDLEVDETCCPDEVLGDLDGAGLAGVRDRTDDGVVLAKGYAREARPVARGDGRRALLAHDRGRVIAERRGGAGGFAHGVVAGVDRDGSRRVAVARVALLSRAVDLEVHQASGPDEVLNPLDRAGFAGVCDRAYLDVVRNQ